MSEILRIAPSVTAETGPSILEAMPEWAQATALGILLFLIVVPGLAAIYSHVRSGSRDVQ